MNYMRDNEARGPSAPGVRPVLTFGQLAEALWRGRRLTLAIVGLTLLVAAVLVRTSTPQYSATMILSPADIDVNTMGRDALGSLGTMFGLRAGRQESQFDEFKTLLTSPEVAAELDSQLQLRQRIYWKRWDAKAQKWRPPGGPVSVIKIAVYWVLGQPTWSAPSANSLARYIGKTLKIEPVGKTDMIRLRFSDPDPRFARDFVAQLHKAADDRVRNNTRYYAIQSINYIKTQLPIVSVAEQKEALIQIYLQQQRMLMLTEVDAPFAARIVQRSIVSDLPSDPNPAKYLGAALFIGLTIGMVLSIFIAQLFVHGRLSEPWQRLWAREFRGLAPALWHETARLLARNTRKK